MKLNDSTPHLMLLVATALLLPLACLSATGRPVHEVRPATADGTVTIEDVSGSVHVEGTDAASVDVSGTIGPKVERVEVTQAGERTTVRVVLPTITMNRQNESDANLTVKVPKGSSVEANVVSADLHFRGVNGKLRLKTVSGDVSGAGGAGVGIATVSGDVKFSNESGGALRVKTTSGDIVLNGMLGVADIDSVSGDVHVELQAAPDARIGVQTVSGDIQTCGGPKPEESRYGPGSRLHFDSGSANGHVRINTVSGDVHWCAPAGKAPH